MTQQEPPKIEFPCENYPIKIMGEASDSFFDFVMEITEQFSPCFDRNNVSVKTSSKGKYHSVTVYITATGVEQLEQYHQVLRSNSAVKIVL
jgi:uncharacterized protein